MDYLTLRQSKDLIPQIESPIFMKWIENNKLHTKGESINLLIEKEYFYKSFSLPPESPPVFIENPISLASLGLKQVETIKDTPLIIIPPKNADFKDSDPISEVTNSEFIDEQVAGIKQAEILSEIEQRKLDADNYYNAKIKEADLYLEDKKVEAEDIIFNANLHKAEADKYTQEVTNKADADLLLKVNEMHDLEVKFLEILPVYKEIRFEMIAWKSTIEKFIASCKVHISEDVWYQKAVIYFESLKIKIDGAVK